MAKTPDPTKDKEFNETLRRALAMPHKPHATPTKKNGSGPKPTPAARSPKQREQRNKRRDQP
ncbi:MAG: hypothetical protein ABL957_05555 [Parvularculaceae bacterium]